MSFRSPTIYRNINETKGAPNRNGRACLFYQLFK
jgi:hypothetical protein